MSDKIKFVALGGLDIYTDNLFCLEINDSIFIVEAGLAYPDKSTPGVDYVIADISYLKVNKDKIKAYIITHSHDDVMGAIPFIYDEIPAPIYMTQFSYDVFSSFVTLLRKDIKKFNIKIVDPNDDLIIDNRKFSLFSVTHNAPFGFGFAIDTSLGNIIYSGEFVLAYNNFHGFELNLLKISKILSEKKTYLLLLDATSAGNEGFTSPNHRVSAYVKNCIQSANGKIYLACYSTNIFNFTESIIELVEAKRKIICYDEVATRLLDLIRKYNIVDIPEELLVPVENISRYPDKDLAIIIADEGEMLYRKVSMLATKDIIEKRLFIKETDTFLLCAIPPANLEVVSIGVIDELYKTDAQINVLRKKECARMHPSNDDIRFFVSLTKPSFFIPIKGQFKEHFACANVVNQMQIGLNFLNIFIIENGYAAYFDETRGRVEEIKVDNVRFGPIMVDGSGVGDVAHEIINERNVLSTDGIVIMACLVSKSKKAIIGGPDVQMRGYLYLKESEAVLKKITSTFVETVEKYLQENTFDEKACIAETKEEISKYTKRTTMRSPIIESEIIVVD